MEKQTETKIKYRCGVCNKKLNEISYFSCRCSVSSTFCAQHRYPHAHNCSFDSKALYKDNLQKTVFLVKDRVIEKI